MVDVFISYSRKDKEFVQVLHQALTKSKYDTWVDWEDIPLTADWWDEIKTGIEAAHTFIFVISPDSIASQVCGQEIDHAAAHNKRLMPIVRREGFEMERVRPVLGKHNWLFFREDDHFDQTFQTLVKALNTDLAHVREHTRILVRAIEWNKKGRNESLALRGSTLEEAEQWLQQNSDQEPKPTALQVEYIRSSRQVEEAHQILLRAGQKARRMIRIGTGVLCVTLGIAAIAGALVQQKVQSSLKLAQEGTRLEQAGASTLRQYQSESAEKIGVLVSAIQTGRELESLIRTHQLQLEQSPATSPLMALQVILDCPPDQLQPEKRLIRTQNTLARHTGAVTGVSFSPDGRYLATAGADQTIQICAFSRPPCRVVRNQGVLTDLNFSPDGKKLAAIGEDGLLRVLEVSQLQSRSISMPGGIITALSFSPDGQQLATVNGEGTLQVWDWSWQTGQLHPKSSAIRSDKGGIINVSFSSEGGLLATSEPNGLVRLRNLAGQVVSEFNSYQDLQQISFSPNGALIATLGLDDGTVKVWNLAGRQVAQFSGNPEKPVKVTFSPDSKQLAIALDNGSVQVKTLRTLSELLTEGCRLLKSSRSFSVEATEVCGR